jgi:hypothetical protein
MELSSGPKHLACAISEEGCLPDEGSAGLCGERNDMVRHDRKPAAHAGDVRFGRLLGPPLCVASPAPHTTASPTSASRGTAAMAGGEEGRLAPEFHQVGVLKNRCVICRKSDRIHLLKRFTKTA